MSEYILTTPDRRQRLCIGGQMGGGDTPPLVFYGESVARAIADAQLDLRPLHLTPVRYTMPDTLPKTAVSAAETIAAIRAQLARRWAPIDYRPIALDVHDAAVSLGASIESEL